MPLPPLKLVYDLRSDQRYISDVQDATLTTKNFGITQDHGLFGSTNWWKAVESGELPLHKMEGILSRVYMSGHNDFAEFELSDGVRKQSWARRGPDGQHVEGAPAMVEYVHTKSRFDNAIRETVVRIWVGESAA